MWIARDENNALWLYMTKPVRHERWGLFTSNRNGDIGCIRLPEKVLPQITWQNSPKKVKMINLTFEEEDGTESHAALKVCGHWEDKTV